MAGQSKEVGTDGKPLSLTEIVKKAGRSFLLCWAVHFAADIFWRKAFPKAFYLQPFTKRIEFPERIVSTLHGLVVGLGAVNEIFGKRTFETGSLATRYSPGVDGLFSFSLGYELYDIMTMIVQGNQPTGMFAHHIMCILGYLACMLSRRVSFYPVSFLITELTVVPTNINWYLKILQAPQSAQFLNNTIRFLSYLIFRTPIIGYVLFKTHQRNQLGNVVSTTPLPFLLLLAMNLLGMTVLNAVWSVGMARVYQRQLLRFLGSS